MSNSRCWRGVCREEPVPGLSFGQLAHPLNYFTVILPLPALLDTDAFTAAVSSGLTAYGAAQPTWLLKHARTALRHIQEVVAVEGHGQVAVVRGAAVR